MKELKQQFYNEGLATTFYLKPINYIKKKIKNKNIRKVIQVIIKILYTILVLLLAGLLFYVQFPL